MHDFWFYIRLGFDHVMDPGAYDHILFLAALALPFTFRSWKKVLLLATVFTIAHCLSLAFSAYGLLVVNSQWIEFLIPVTILLTALFNFYFVTNSAGKREFLVHLPATAFFGFIHGFGFSNYFNMMMAGSDEKGVPLLGFAGGIELSQLLVILLILAMAYLLQEVLGLKRKYFIVFGSIIILLSTIPMLLETFPR